MTTTDANGIAFLEDTDLVAPLHTTINMLQSATSEVVGSVRRGPLFAADQAERDLLLTTFGSSPTEPLVVNVAGSLQRHNGTNWRLMNDRTRGSAISGSVVTLAVGPSNWTDIASVTVVTLGGPCRAEGSAMLANANSGSFKWAAMRLMIDATAHSVVVPDIALQFVSGASTGVPASFTWPITTLSAGTHTLKLQAQGSAASSVQCKAASLIVIEQP